MTFFPSPERLARFSTRKPWTVVLVWVAILVVSIAAASRVGSVLTTSAELYVTTESQQANDLIVERLSGRLPGRETVVVQSASQVASDPAYRAFVEDLTGRIRALGTKDIANVTNAYESPDMGLVSASGRTTLLPVELSGSNTDAESHVDGLLALLKTVDGTQGFTVVTGGDGSASRAFTETSQSDLETAEIFGIPIAILILVVVFGALVAAGLPLLLGLAAIIVAIGVTALIGQAFELSTFVINFVTTMGLAVGIDYTLLIIQRFREERARGLTVDEAIARAGATASRSVLFSGMAVVVALIGMVLVPQSIFRSLGVGAILVVAAAVAAALTLLPAVLRLLGDRVNSARIRIPGRRRERVAGPGFWDRSTRQVQAHPVISLLLAGGLLILASIPYFTIELGNAGVGTLPNDTEAKRAFAILGEEFSAGVLSPTRVVIDGQAPGAAPVRTTADRVVAAINADGAFGAAVVRFNQAGDLAVVSAPVTGDPQSDLALTAVNRLRGELESAAGTYVTGNTAETIDATGVIEDYTIPVFAFVLGLSFVILLVVFRSIVVPLKAIAMNMLSVGAAYGLMVLVFQWGYGNELMGFARVEQIEFWVPLFMFAVLFGLSMDYHVFLLSRIREHYEQTGDNSAAVAHGVHSTAGMITGAAAIMIAVFSGFAAGQMVMFQQMGFGLAVAVLLDATLVRMVLVPASMELLGARNWYLPRWLEWLPKIDVEGHAVRVEEPLAAFPAGADALPGR